MEPPNNQTEENQNSIKRVGILGLDLETEQNVLLICLIIGLVFSGSGFGLAFALSSAILIAAKHIAKAIEAGSGKN